MVFDLRKRNGLAGHFLSISRPADSTRSHARKIPICHICKNMFKDITVMRVLNGGGGGSDHVS